MDRREFGRSLAAGAVGAGLVGAAAAAQDKARPKDADYRVFPDLPVKREVKIRTGGDYHSVAGNGGITSEEALNYFRRFNARYITGMARSTATAAEMADFPHAGAFLNASGPWDLDELKRGQDACHNADMVMEGVRMDSAYIIMKEGPVRER